MGDKNLLNKFMMNLNQLNRLFKEGTVKSITVDKATRDELIRMYFHEYVSTAPASMEFRSGELRVFGILIEKS